MMGLKQFHVFFIASSIGLMSYILLWARQQAVAGHPWPGALAAAAVGAAASLFYLAWFLRRYKTLA